MSYLTNVVFDDVHDDTVTYIGDPPEGWASIDDCGEFPCTAPQNIVSKFSTVTCTGTNKPGFCGDTGVDFTIVS